MYLEIVSKILSESLLSLYPIFVKLINIPYGLQVWSRFFTYMFASSFFVDWSFIFKTIFSKSGLLLSFVTVLHIYSTYRGFQLLDSGVSYIIFYLYPLFILLLAGKKIGFIMIFAIIGVYLLSRDNFNSSHETKDASGRILEKFGANPILELFKYEGIIMMLISALTEAFIYFIVRSIKTDNNWNHLFISYALGAVILTVYYANKTFSKKDQIQEMESFQSGAGDNSGDNSGRENAMEEESKPNKNLSRNLLISILINIIIGLFGYLLRFYAMTNLDATIYAPLSYFGILTAYIYGAILNKEKITINKIVGTICILIPNIYLLIK